MSQKNKFKFKKYCKMSYHLIKSPAKLSAGVEHAAANCGGGGNGTTSTSSFGGSFSLHQSMSQTGEPERDKFTGWVTEVTWVVFMFSFSLAVAVLLVLWWCSRRRSGEYQDTEEQNQIYRNRSFDK